MQFVRVSTDVWGQEVLEGISWDLLPVAIAVGAVVVVGHALYLLIRHRRPAPKAEDGGASLERLERHAAIDRSFHWLTALSVLTLMATGLLPVIGVKFAWVTIHWITGVVLTLLVVFHLVRASLWQSLRTIWISAHDFGMKAAARPEKYTLAQKLMHHAMTLAVLIVVITGVLMLMKIDTPFWQRNPYVFAADTWGIIYVLHGLATLTVLTLAIIHIYFALIPENRMYLRAMIRGWMTRAEFQTRHNAEPRPTPY